MVLRGDAAGYVVSPDIDAGPVIGPDQLPSHRHRAREGRIIGFEVDCLDDADVRHHLDEADIDHVGVGGGLAPAPPASAYVSTMR